MRKRYSTGKRIIAAVLLVAMMLLYLPENMRLILADETPEEEGYVTEVASLNVWDKVWLEDSVIVTENTTITGEVIMEPEVSIVLVSGQLVIESQATVNGDIYVEEGASLSIGGTVNGTVYVNSTEAGAQKEDWDGSLVRSNNLEAHAGAHIDHLILNGVGFGWLDCSIGTMDITEQYNADYNTGNNAVIQVLNYNGSASFGNSGHILQANVTGGKDFSNNTDGIIDCIRVNDGLFYNNGLVRFATLESTGRIYNTNVQERQWQEAMIEHLVIKEDAADININGEHFLNFENYGNVKTLIAYGGEICTMGDIDYFYTDGCRRVFIETVSWRVDRGTDYQVEYLFANNTEVSFFDSTDFGTQKPYVRKARIENGILNLDNAKIEELFLQGSFAEMILNRVEIYELYLGQFELTAQTNVKLVNPKELILVDFGASAEVKDAYDLIMAEYSDMMSEENKTLIEEFMFDVRELTHSGNTVAEQEFTKNINQYDLVALEFSASAAVGAVLVESPSGYEFVIMSKDDTSMESFMAYESGEYQFTVIGGEYGATLDVEVTSASKLDVSLFTKYASEFPEIAPKNEASLAEYRISLYDKTSGTAIDNFTVDGEQILFRENPKGHTFILTLSSITESWEWEDVSVEFTLSEGETKPLEIVVKQFGDYYGNVEDGTVPQVYLYDAAGNILKQCDTDSYGNFWAGRLPSGEYTAVILRDDTGSYKFSKLKEYDAYGLLEKEDYLKDTFTLEAGLNICYPNITLPEAPTVENEYFDTDVTAFNTNRQVTVAEELILLSLDYAFKEEVANKAVGIVFKFELSEDIELKKGSITSNGKLVSDYAIEDGCLVVPVDETSGSICFQIASENTDVTLTTTAVAEFVYGGKECAQFLGTTSTYITALTLKVPDMVSGSVMNVTGYTTPNQEVVILDNGEVIGTLTSNASGYFSGSATLLSDVVQNHKICAATGFETDAEVRTAEQIVSVTSSMPELQQFNMYYYVHGHSAKFELTGEEFQTKRFIYDYWPGSVFTFEIKMSRSDRIEELYVVSNNGSVKKLQAFYQPEEDLWVASGIFSEDENYAPADFDIEYLLHEIDVATEIGDFDFWRDAVINPELVDIVYEDAEKELSDITYDEKNNTASGNLTIDISEEEEYSLDFDMSYQPTTDTKESLLAQGYECYVEDGVECFIKYDMDYTTYDFTTTVKILCEDTTDLALSSGLTLFAEGGTSGRGVYTQSMTSNMTGVIANQVYAGTGGDIGKLPNISQTGKIISEVIKAGNDIAPLTHFAPVTNAQAEAFANVMDGISILKGEEQLSEQQKYFDKLDEITRKLDQIAEAQSKGKGGMCQFVSLASFYDDVAASYAAVGALTNSKWQLAIMKKTCSTVADIALSKGVVKSKVKDAKGNDKIITKKLDNYITFPEINVSSNKKTPVQMVVGNVINHAGDVSVDEWLSVPNWIEKGMDKGLEGTFDFWTDANAAHIDQLDHNVNLLLELVGGDDDKLGSASAAAGNAGGGAGGAAAAGGGGGSGSGRCFDPSGLNPFPGGTTPGGGGGVQWDPSGYVYEAVPSNRLPGVTAVTYYRGKDSSEVLWDAEEYGQINPQVTDSQGCYGWFVPEGDWKVVYTKDGYEAAETEWLPVPPPQTEVNVGLVSTEAPELGYVVVSPSNVLVSFSKYVTVDSVTDSVLFVKDASGNTLSVTLEAVNAEAGDDGTMLASKFRMLFVEQATVGSVYTVVVKDSITGYNGLNVKATEQTSTCAIQPESISVELADYAVVGAETKIKVTITADGGFDVMRLECTSDDSFLEVVSIGAVAADGTAELIVRGKKAGVSLLTVGVTGSDVTCEWDVVTASEQDAGLMKYVEKQKNQAAVVPVVENKADNFMMIWIVLAAVLVVLAGVFGVVLAKKRKKTA